MLEYRLEPEGGLLVCALGTLEVGGGQIVECSLCLSDILPERRVALAVELLEGEQLRGTRLYTVPPHHEDGPADVLATVGLRGPVDCTVVNGRVVVKEGHLVTIDEEKTAADARKACGAYLAKA